VAKRDVGRCYGLQGNYSLLGGFRIKPFVYQNKSVFSCSKFDAKGSAAKPLELLKPSSFL
jgi:hypothetical protein